MAEIFMALSLGAAAVQDVHNRMINDLTWFLAVPGVALAIWSVIKAPPMVLYLYVLDAVIGVALAVAIWVTKSMGEADAIGIALISAATVQRIPPTPLAAALNAPIIATLINSMLFTIPFIAWNVSVNVARLRRCEEMGTVPPLRRLAYVLFLTCEQSSIIGRKPWAFSPGKLSLRVSDEEVKPSEGKKYVLVSYNMPYVAYMFLGYVVYLFLGDLLLLLVAI